MREVPTAGSSVAIENGNGGGEVVPHTETRTAIDGEIGVGEVSGGTELAGESEGTAGSVGVSLDSDDVECEIVREAVRCPGGVAA